jgi:hypothetical protein
MKLCLRKPLGTVPGAALNRLMLSRYKVNERHISSYVKEVRCFNIETFFVDWGFHAEMLNLECFDKCAVHHIDTGGKFPVCE